jgi:hypothetical protein
MKAYKGGILQVHAGSIPSVQNWDDNFNSKEGLLSGAGSVDTLYAAILEQSPRATFMTPCVDSALTLIGLDGLAIVPVSTVGVIAWLTQMKHGGVNTESTTHQKHAIDDGLICLRNITAVNNEFAEANYEIYATTQDGTNPVTTTSDVALPATAPAVATAFTLGGVKVNGTMWDVQRFSYDTGIEVELLGSNGTGFPSFASIVRRQPRISLQTKDLSLVTTITRDGLDLSALVVFLRKIAKGGMRVAAATEEHISFTGTDGLVKPDNISVTPGKSADFNVEIVPVFDGTNAALTVDTTAAIA